MHVRSYAVLCMFLLGACTAPPPQPQGTSAPPAGWNTYTNTEYGFTIAHPPHSTIEQVGNYIRLQNYTSDNDGKWGLDAGQYYLELFVHTQPETDFLVCKHSVAEGKTVGVSGFEGYRGFGDQAGDPGGRRFQLCVKTPAKHYTVMTTENSQNGETANAILDSFTLTP